MQVLFTRSESCQADSADSGTTDADPAKTPKITDEDVEAGGLSDNRFNQDRGQQSFRGRHRINTKSRLQSLVKKFGSVKAVIALLLMQLLMLVWSVCNSIGIHHLMRHPIINQTPVAQPPRLHQVSLANFILDPRSSPSCHGNRPQSQPCWRGNKYITIRGLGPLAIADEDGDNARLGLELTPDQTEIRILRSGTFAVDAHVRIRMDSGIPSISGGIQVNGTLKLACDQTLDVTDSKRLQGRVLTCKVNSYLTLRAGDRVRMEIQPHHPVQLPESSLEIYIKILRLG